VSATQTSRNPIEAAREIAGHATRLVKLQVELRTVGLKSKATRVGIGAALGLLALLLAPLVVVFALATAAAALATVVHVWLAILIVTCILLVFIALLVGSAVWLIRKGLKGGTDGK
jgi:Putative Actinobacterial Holin-X, holin superfamily III